MNRADTLKIIGVSGSPYTRKMLGLLRYRAIPYRLTWGDPKLQPSEMIRALPKPKVMLLPLVYFPNDDGSLEPAVDSTPIIRRLEQEYSGRSVIPSHSALAFLDYLLEDFADEWCTKYMFHYRWDKTADIDWAGTMIPLWVDYTMSPMQHQQLKTDFAARQIERISVVGSNPTTRPIIEASYRELLTCLEAHFKELPFLLGRRPAACDFALYGQLTQLLTVDPSPMAIAREIAPRCCAWVDCMEDLSGLEPSDEDWLSPEQLPETLVDLLTLVGKSYVPAMLRNAEAIAQGEAEWACELMGARWQQQSFPYQAKSLAWVREHYEKLNEKDKELLNPALEQSQCGNLFS